MAYQMNEQFLHSLTESKEIMYSLLRRVVCHAHVRIGSPCICQILGASYDSSLVMQCFMSSIGSYHLFPAKSSCKPFLRNSFRLLRFIEYASYSQSSSCIIHIDTYHHNLSVSIPGTPDITISVPQVETFFHLFTTM